MSENLCFAVRASDALSLFRGTNSPTSIFQTTANNGKSCRISRFSNTGQYFAYCDGVKTVVIEIATAEEAISVDLPRTQKIVFSTKDHIMITYEPHVTYGPRVNGIEGRQRKPPPNMRIWTLPDGRLLAAVTAQNNSGKMDWSDDESCALRVIGSELMVYRNNIYEKYHSKLAVPKIDDFALSRGSEPYHCAIHIRAFGGQPALTQIRKLDNNFTVVASKTIFKCDRANLLWNCKGTALIALAIVDVDQSNKSYYGEQILYLMSINGESCMVTLSKQGPIYCVKWNPNGKEFAVCYGFMPARVSFYNVKGECVFDMGEGPRNDLYYNRFGNILIVCGFGNIASGNMEFWDVGGRKEIIKIQVPNTTFLEWAPDGQLVITATTAPRLRMDNCYRIWHFTGKLIYEFLCKETVELFQVQWRPVSDGIYHPFPLPTLTSDDKAKAGLIFRSKNADESHPANNLPAGSISKISAYVPPHLRKRGIGKGGLDSAITQKAVKSEIEKKIMNLRKKIDDIAKLKKRMLNGETLEANQLQKIEKECGWLKELEALKLSTEN